MQVELRIWVLFYFYKLEGFSSSLESFIHTFFVKYVPDK